MSNAQYRTQLLTSIFQSAQKIALEEEKTDGKVSKEIEYMFYAKLDNLAALQKASSVEVQEQWGLWYDKSENTAGTGSIRVRRITPKDLVDGNLVAVRSPTQYVQTIKIKTKEGDALEIPGESSPDAFKAFKILADSGMAKHRYRFDIPESGKKPYFIPGSSEPIAYAGTNLTWEVDMFVIPGGLVYGDTPQYFPWCKIDLEVSDRSVEIPAFPEGFSEAFDSKSPDLSVEQKQIVAEMKQFLSLPNAYVEKFYQDI